MGQSSNAKTEELSNLRSRISAYRSTRHARCPLPAELWTEAAALGRQVGVHRAAEAVGVSYEALPRRGDGRCQRHSARRPPSTAFVEVGGAAVLGAAFATVLELCATDGTRLTIRLHRSEQLDLAALIAAFRARR